MSEQNGKAPRVVSNRGIASKFRELLERSPGQVFYLRDLMDALEAPEVAIQNTGARAVREHPDAYRVHIPARAWVYAPNGTATRGNRVFEELTVTKAGEILIQDEHGTIYRATEV